MKHTDNDQEPLDPQDEHFLQRWSRRKIEADRAQDGDAAGEPTAGSIPAPGGEVESAAMGVWR